MPWKNPPHGAGEKKKKSPLINHFVYFSGADFYKALTSSRTNNFMSLLSSLPYCLLKTKCSIFGQEKKPKTKTNPTLIRSFFPKTFKIGLVPLIEDKTL